MTRDETIKILKKEIDKSKYISADVSIEVLETAIEALKERKTGKWIITARNGVLCSECKSGTRKMPMLFGKPLYKYCPFCGLPMEVPDAESN